MCGIVGCVGRRPVTPILIDALRRLEYRGYDSAGIATLTERGIDRRRAEGKLERLAARLAEDPISGTTGIGHTRWATHGVPNETNAHPHRSMGVAVVHNGIIENFQALRSELEGLGHHFETQTDTEVVPHLV
ncbi:MAG: glutamine--fructose-6-phosphate aminotransferase, partial [Geminicoccaceae bacterium]|nr:glutamine--fructose-6-phosphate aminotransferase [Geminicoccaceae bacterium]